MSKRSTFIIDSKFSPEELCLIECLFREKETVAVSIDEKKLLDTATKNGLSQLFYKNDYSKKLSDEAQKRLKDEYYFNLGKNATFQLIASEITQKLNEKNIPVIFLKGISLISEVYKDIALRPMSDIDIMTPSQHVYDAWQTINPNAVEMKRNDVQTGHHLPGFNYRGIYIELHRSLLSLDLKYKIPDKEVLNNLKRLEDFNALTLNPVHQIIYLILHIYYTYIQGGLRLGWFYDLKALQHKYEDQITLENVEKLSNYLKIYKPVRKMLVFFTVLFPESRLSINLSKKDKKEALKMIKMLQSSDSMKMEYSYGYAWERFSQTKGLKNKCLFLFNALLDDGKGKQKFSFKRVMILIKNTLKFLWRRFF